MDGAAEKPHGTSSTPPEGRTQRAIEQRQQYRVSSGLDGILAVALILGDGVENPAQLVDVSAGGACVRCPVKDLVVLDVGQQIRLRMRSPMAKGPLTVNAQVRWCDADDEGNVRYGVQFLDLEESTDQINPALRWIFNRRRTPR